MELPPPFSRWRRELRPSFATQLPPLVSLAGDALPEAASLRLFDRLAQGLAPRDVSALHSVCPPRALDRWLLGALTAWEQAKGPTHEAWIFRGLASLGGESVVRAVGRRIERWAKAGQLGWSVHGITVLANAGDDLAILTLTRLTQTASDGRVRHEASAALDRLAAARGVDRDALEMGALPDLGFDASGRATLDYGGRAFAVELDEGLEPWVVVDGARQPKAPPTRATDDEAQAKEARALFRAWQLELRMIARTRTRMLELAMRTERRWPASELLALWVRPATVRPLARRVLFATDAGARFRVDDEGSFADSYDAPFELDADALVGVAHPLAIDEDERARWRQVLEDYAIMPAFAQLDRETHGWPAATLGESEEPRCRGWRVHPARLRALTGVGWREQGWEGAVQGLVLPLAPRLEARLRLATPYRAADLGRADARVELDVLALEGRPADFGDLSPIARSELARDLEALRPSS
ncbi:MAG: DUF4132 domain-containing protein [Myxococcales bacterium]|nr:DUF4132 domain-containing protein [Myxococcales bacterium]